MIYVKLMLFRISHLGNYSLTGCIEPLQAESSANRGGLTSRHWRHLQQHGLFSHLIKAPFFKCGLTNAEGCFREHDYRVNQAYYSKSSYHGNLALLSFPYHCCLFPDQFSSL